jgi:hypothetical protein
MLFNLLLYLGELLLLIRAQLGHVSMPNGVAENLVDLLDHQPDVGLEPMICEQRWLQLVCALILLFA